nr:L274 [uncultured bacterium]
MPHVTPQPTHDEAIAATRRWLERAVIGLNLCPFAKHVHDKGQVRYAVSRAQTSDALLDDLERELKKLVATKAEILDTTLLIVPYTLTAFEDFVKFLDLVEFAVKIQGLVGVVQVASFHPQYQFAGTEGDDVSNYTNRAPYPTLHLLREASLTRAVEAFPDTDEIYQRNIRTLRTLGVAGWRALAIDAPTDRQAMTKPVSGID